MAIYKRKTVKEIKTHAGTIRKTFLPHEAYMKISTLEMERVHRLRELEGAQKRINTIKDRLEELDIKKNDLLKQITAMTNNFQGNMQVSAHEKVNNVQGNTKGQLLKY